MSETTSHRPGHLDPSELGNKEYWDIYYQNDLDQDAEDEDEDEEENGGGDDNDLHHHPADPADLESWFDDVDAPAKVLEYLTSEDFPYSPENTNRQLERPRVLDLGTGNGSMLFMLRTEGRYEGPMVGVDYSKQSVDLARRLCRSYSKLWSEDDDDVRNRDCGGDGDGDGDGNSSMSMRFETMDLIHDDPSSVSWWPTDGFDLVLDKGTFDAISLSSQTVVDPETGKERRICELYPRKVVNMIAPGGYLLITSCNWTEEEVMRWFLKNEDVAGCLELFGKIEYPVFEFGGQKGSGVASVCFRRVRKGD